MVWELIVQFEKHKVKPDSSYLDFVRWYWGQRNIDSRGGSSSLQASRIREALEALKAVGWDANKLRVE